MQAEPKTIVNFLAEHFDALNYLFEIQCAQGIIPSSVFVNFANEFGHIESKLFDYKILRKAGDDAEFRGEIHALMQFLNREFTPLLPETIEKYYHSINNFYHQIQEGIGGDKTILSARILQLNHEIKGMTESIENNTVRLLEETRKLKSNVTKIDYREKVEKASFWIDYYISPLNKILDITHSSSILNKLLEISNFCNVKRLSYGDEIIRIQFERLYFMLVQSNIDLLRQSKILTNELLPLIERLRTESLILTGWIEFLKNPGKVIVPALLKNIRHNVYSDEMYFHARDYVMQFVTDKTIYIQEDPIEREMWIFRKEVYKQKLTDQLPVEDFFGWAISTLRNDYKKIDTDKLFSLTSLLFEHDLLLEISQDSDRTIIKTADLTLSVPKINIRKNGLS